MLQEFMEPDDDPPPWFKKKKKPESEQLPAESTEQK